MARNYGWEKFYTGVLTLAQGDWPVRRRLAEAYVSSIMHVRPDEDLPPELRQDFAYIKDALSRVPAKGDEGSAASSAAALDDLEVHKIVEKIVTMADSLAKYGPHGSS